MFAQYQSEFQPKHTRTTLSSLSSVSSSNSIVDFNTGDLLPDLWQTSSNESSVSDGLDYINALAFSKRQQQPSPHHFSSFHAKVQTQPQISPFDDTRYITQPTLLPEVHPLCQNYTQSPVQRASQLWQQGPQSTVNTHTPWSTQSTANTLYLDEPYDIPQQMYLLDEEIPCNISKETTAIVKTSSPPPPSAAPSHPESPRQQAKSKTVNTQLYKTELCGPFMKTGTCPYGVKCQFAHGEAELKHIERPPKWRSKPCANWAKYGSCRYGNRCCFKHGD